MNFDIRPVTMEQFRDSIPKASRADSFAYRFISKASFSEKWPLCKGAWVGDELAAAIITTLSRHQPVTANLQLLHTFARWRRKGAARLLVEMSVREAWEQGALYYRVSSEPDAQEFYRSLGFRFWGEQMSGTLMCMFRMGGPQVKDGVWDISDPNIRIQVHPTNPTKRGAVVRFFGDAV